MKKDVLKKIIDLGVFALVLVLGFLWINKIFGYQDNIHSKSVFEQFYDLPDNVVDVAWIGPSSVQEYIIPSQMYEERGITLYPLAIGSMPFDATELLIKEFEKTQDPKLYLVDLRDIAFSALSDPGIRRITDNMAFSRNRIDLVEKMLSDWESCFPGKKEDRFDYYFSFMKYHSRWTELQKTDFTDDEDCFMGYWISTKTTKYDKKEVLARLDSPEVSIPEENIRFLNEFLDFCDTFEKKVIFTCTPNCLDEVKFGQYNFAKRIITERGYEVWDLNENVDEMGLDFEKDFGGVLHVNVHGAEKVTRYVADRLCSVFSLADHRGEEKCAVYEKCAARFHKRMNEVDLTHEENLDAYLDQLSLMTDGYTIYMATNDIQGKYLNTEHAGKLQKLGLTEASALATPEYHSYLAIISDGEVLCESLGQDGLDSVYESLVGNTKVSLSSASWIGLYGCSIRLGQDEMSLNERGLNIVVVNSRTGEVLDSVAFDTGAEDLACKRWERPEEE